MLLSVTDTTAIYASAHPRDRVRRASGLVLTHYPETGEVGVVASKALSETGPPEAFSEIPPSGDSRLASSHPARSM
jgi:hypothetical protein